MGYVCNDMLVSLEIAISQAKLHRLSSEWYLAGHGKVAQS